jgi:hypothetical protein
MWTFQGTCISFVGKPGVMTCVCFQVEDCKMSTVSVRNKARDKFLKLNGIKAMQFDPGDTNQNCSFPPNTIPLENQVAGHSFGDGKNTLGNNRFVFLTLNVFNCCHSGHF